MDSSRPPLYPVFLDLAKKPVLLIGGGEIAFRKADRLLESGCRLKVVAPRISPSFRDWIDKHRVEAEDRSYQPGEAAGYFLVVAATDDPEVNRRVSADALRAQRLVNVADEPRLCNLQVPSTLRRGGLTIAISSGGDCPALARKLRSELEELVPQRYGPLLEKLASLRTHLKRRIPDSVERRNALEQILASDTVSRFLQGEDAPLEELLQLWKDKR